MTKTKNYGLHKADQQDYYDVDVVNDNLDKIDKQMGKQSEALKEIVPAATSDIDAIIAGSYSGDTDPDPPDPSDVATDQDIDDIVNNLF